MKKSLVSALAALAMVVGGVAPAANAVTDGFTMRALEESGPASSPAVTVPAETVSVGMTVSLTPTSGATWLNDGNAHTYAAVGTVGNSSQFATTGTPRIYLNGSSSALASSYNSGAQAYSVTIAANQSTPGRIDLEYSTMSAGFSYLSAGAWTWVPSLKLDGVTTPVSSLTGYTVEYSYKISHMGATTLSTSTRVKTQGDVCIDLTGVTSGTLAISNSVAGVVGFTNSASDTLTAKLQTLTDLRTMGSRASLSNANGIYSYSITGALAEPVLIASAVFVGPRDASGTESLGITAKLDGAPLDTFACTRASIPAPTATQSGGITTITYTEPSAYASQHNFVCRYTPRMGGSLMTAPGTSNNDGTGRCVVMGLNALSNYIIWIEETFGESQTAKVTSALLQQSSTPSQVVVVTPVAPVVPVFKQPKFAMPSKIDVDTTGKVSLSGKDMGVSTVLIGGKEQKIDTNSDEKLVFDTTGLAKGVHDLVMKGAFGTYTVQKAIQVGEAVVTKVAAVSARQVGMAGGELSISGQGLEGTSQITMNGQVLEIVSKTDSKVTFKVPASTVASVNSIMIEGSFVPVIFKNAFSYTK